MSPSVKKKAFQHILTLTDQVTPRLEMIGTSIRTRMTSAQASEPESNWITAEPWYTVSAEHVLTVLLFFIYTTTTVLGTALVQIQKQKKFPALVYLEWVTGHHVTQKAFISCALYAFSQPLFVNQANMADGWLVSQQYLWCFLALSCTAASTLSTIHFKKETICLPARKAHHYTGCCMSRAT